MSGRVHFSGYIRLANLHDVRVVGPVAYVVGCCVVLDEFQVLCATSGGSIRPFDPVDGRAFTPPAGRIAFLAMRAYSVEEF
jgi:hypothetical protein